MFNNKRNDPTQSKTTVVNTVSNSNTFITNSDANVSQTRSRHCFVNAIAERLPPILHPLNKKKLKVNFSIYFTCILVISPFLFKCLTFY